MPKQDHEQTEVPDLEIIELVMKVNGQEVQIIDMGSPVKDYVYKHDHYWYNQSAIAPYLVRVQMSRNKAIEPNLGESQQSVSKEVAIP